MNFEKAKVSNGDPPHLTSLGIRYYAFQIDPESPPRRLNPLWPPGGRFLDPFIVEGLQDQVHPKSEKNTPSSIESEKEESLHAASIRAVASELKDASTGLESGEFPLDEVCSMLGGACSGALQILAMLADNGDEDALWQLLNIAKFATTNLNQLGTENPALVKMARREPAWPTLVSPHAQFSPAWKVNDLPIGQDFLITLSKKSRFEIREGAGKIAWLLFCYVHSTRARAIAAVHARAASQERFRSFLQKKPARNSPTTVAKENHSKLPPTMATALTEIEKSEQRELTIEEGAALLALSNDSLIPSRWWKIARRCLIEAYPRPNDPGKLNENEPGLRALVTAPSHRTTPGALQSRILTMIEEKFESLCRYLQPSEVKPDHSA